MKRDLMNHLHPVVAIAPQVAADDAAIVGEVIDTKGHRGLCLVINTGTANAAAFNATVLLEESDNADFSESNPVDDDQLNGTEALAGFTADDDNSCRKLGYVGYKRYVRLTVTPTGNDADLPLSAVAVFGMSEQQPQPNPPA